MMNWLQDKKNLPIVIALFVIVLGVVGYLFYTQFFAGPSTTVGPSTTGANPNGVGGPMPDSAPRSAGMPGTGAPGPGAPPAGAGAPVPPPATNPAPATASAPAPAGAPTPMAPGGPRLRRRGAPAMAAATAPGAPAAGAKTQVAVVPTPREAWRDDPFLPIDYKKPVTVKHGVQVLIIPPPPYPWPKDLIRHGRKRDDIEMLKQQPPRRVAGIVFSQRVSALLETPDGWETVRPGDKLRDGTTVERIERDRVVLKTTDKTPRMITIKLAAAAILPETGGSSSPTPPPSGGRMYPGGGGYGPPRTDM